MNKIQFKQISELIDESEFSNEMIYNLHSLKFVDYDSEQVCIQFSDDVWLYSQLDYDSSIIGPDRDESDYRTEFMDWNNFESEDLMELAIESYYESVEEVKSIYKDDWRQIIMECSFEKDMQI